LSIGTTLIGKNAYASLFFSEYVEGSSNNKALEIFNNEDYSINLYGFSVKIYFNGSATNVYTYNFGSEDIIEPYTVNVLANTAADASILAVTDYQWGGLIFNGDDAITLENNGTVVDRIGQVGFDPGAEWGSGLVSTQDNTLRRKSSITTGDTSYDEAFDPSIEWDGYAQNTFNGLGYPGAEVSPVPIPAAAWLLGSGLIGIVGIRKKFKK